MKTVRLANDVVVEIIPDYALPVEKWYGENFAKQCVEAPDDVEQGYVYQDGAFYPAPDPEPEPIQPTIEERTAALEEAVLELMMQG